MLAHLRHQVASATLLAILVAAVPFAAPARPAEAAVVSASGVTTGDLRSVTFVSATTGFAAASDGVIVKTVDGGESWTQVRTADAYSFRGIDFWDTNTGVAVDYSGKVASTINGGTTWVDVDFTPYADMDGGAGDGSNRTHYDVACSPTDNTVTVAAGDEAPLDGNWYGGMSMGANATNLRYWGNPLTETKPHRWYNAGDLTWYDVGKGELLDIEYVGTTIWASGIDYYTLDASNPSKYPLFKSTNGGVSYTKIEGFGTANLRLEGVAFGSASAGITVGQLVGGNRKAYFTTDGGTVWTSATTLPGTTVLNAVDMSSATHGWAVSSDGGIIRTTDGGANWTACTITGGNPYPLYDVEFIAGTTTGWAVGASGTVLLTSDGITWRQPTGGAPNTAPVATADTYTTAEDTPKVVAAPGVLGNDTDADGDTLTAIKVTNPSNGSVTLNANGSFTYTPNADWNGTDSFTYKANDGEDDSNTVTVTITVSAVNDAPVATADSYTTTEDTAKVVPALGVLSNDTDTEGATLTAIKVTDPSNGSVTLNSNGSFTYTPNANWSGTDSFTYKANDGSADSNTVTVTITVTAVNDAPVAVADTYTTPVNTAKVVPLPGVLGNDTDTEGTALTAIKVTNPSHGSVTLNSDGSFTYTPAASWSGTDSFTYKATDGSADSNTVTVTITVTPGAPVTLAPVYRFYNFTNNTHFFTPSAAERDMVIRTWPNIYRYEGIAYNTNPANNTQPLYRFYNRVSASHFYTASTQEKDHILATWPTVFNLDGQTYAVNPGPVANAMPVYRFFNRTNGSHFYTASETERNNVIATWPHIYTYEGPAFWLGQ